MRLTILAVAAAALAMSVSVAQAATVVVDAKNNSSSGGVAATFVSLGAGQTVTYTSSLNDLWSAGALPRYSDANGLVADRYATALDDSGQPVGTKIGQDFGMWSQGGFSAPYGSLVGLFNGAYKLLGANGSFTAPSNGTLKVFYWDSNNGDNFGTIKFNLGGVPEASTWALMILGLGAIGGAMRRRQAVRVSFAS